MKFRGAYHQALLEEHSVERTLKAMLLSSGLLLVLLAVLAVSVAIAWILGGFGA